MLNETLEQSNETQPEGALTSSGQENEQPSGELTSDGNEGLTSIKAEELEQLKREAGASGGRAKEVGKLTKENESLRKQNEDFLKRLEALEDSQISPDDPNAQEKKTNLQLRRDALKKDQRITELEQELEGKNEVVKEVQTATQKQALQKIADGYENGDKLLPHIEGMDEEKAIAFCKEWGKPKVTTPNQRKPADGIGEGGGLSDKTFIDGIGSGKIPLTKENLARAKKLGLA